MDGTEGRKDASQIEDPSSVTRGTSETPRTFTEETEKKAVLDALSAAGREAKTLAGKTEEANRLISEARQVAKDIAAEQVRWQAEEDDRALDAVRDDTTELARVRRSIDDRENEKSRTTKLAEERQQLDRDKAEHKERLDKADKVTKELSARDTAIRHDVDVESLIKFTDGSPEAMEELAQALPKKGGSKPSLAVDSGKTIGGGASFEQIREDMIKNPSDDTKMRRYMEAKKTQGK